MTTGLPILEITGAVKEIEDCHAIKLNLRNGRPEKPVDRPGF
jgi:hypothetical protein